MKRSAAALGSSLFFALAPGVVAGVIPWWITGWEFEPVWWPLRAAGAVVTAAAAAVLVHAFARFVREGIGTPAPVAPTQHLVVGGLYRYVRNPMYVAVVAAVVGQAALFGQP
ncbi:MAG TPA: methyltransferase, partial [Solirubrobacter sp.]|nr:methyltransferase [Solirubrobacter sp.]